MYHGNLLLRCRNSGIILTLELPVMYILQCMDSLERMFLKGTIVKTHHADVGRRSHIPKVTPPATKSAFGGSSVLRDEAREGGILSEMSRYSSVVVVVAWRGPSEVVVSGRGCCTRLDAL